MQQQMKRWVKHELTNDVKYHCWDKYSCFLMAGSSLLRPSTGQGQQLTAVRAWQLLLVGQGGGLPAQFTTAQPTDATAHATARCCV